jgi:hypothetical protein
MDETGGTFALFEKPENPQPMRHAQHERATKPRSNRLSLKPNLRTKELLHEQSIEKNKGLARTSQLSKLSS